MSFPLISLRQLTLAVAACVVALAPLQAQVRPLHSRDLLRLSQVQIDEYLKRSDVIFIPVGSVETSGISPGAVDWVTPLGYAMAAADEIDALYMQGLPWSYPGTTMNATGSISITPRQGTEFLMALAESLYRAGFRRQVYLSSGHGPAALTVGTLVREFFDKYQVPLLYIDMAPQLNRLSIPANERTRLRYGVFQITGRLIDLPVQGDYGQNVLSNEPIPRNEGHAELGRLGLSGSFVLGSWVTDPRSHGGGAQTLPANAAEREQWGKEGEAQIRAIVKKMNFAAAMENLKKHDEYTNKVLVPKYEKFLSPEK